ncbi:hypothetical protein ChUKH1_05865 [Cryptosporidium hominis]|uniref:Uncharacterized protein n=1 Tax=Cryptosporidium hominis TaxID=237895 RepID=A0ABX5BFI8_CRYHO|nr:hypothetical protein [Cryptosporidium hominis TU502]OLQ18580.1 hypothetical protein ChTU502y2012_411g0285 [Cryptosporidium hominis]PPA63944.1 hypothetical protein ChUKH1_05865 [Cryptosporidium hominis]PPS97107.1 Uncharacterized protein GY17_00001111 [Cryptosporidium hominis]|eukprot:PPS97107.1 Uncharacterized protein GY17_00001111 [Cryptosporidium hominis]
MTKITREERERREKVNREITRLAQQEKWLESFRPKREEKNRVKVQIKKKAIKIVKEKVSKKKKKLNSKLLQELNNEIQRMMTLYENKAK